MCSRIDLYFELETLIYLSCCLSQYSRNIKWNRDAVSSVKGKRAALSDLCSPSFRCLCQRQMGIATVMRIASCLEVLWMWLRLTKESHSLLPNPMPTTNSLCFWVSCCQRRRKPSERETGLWQEKARCTKLQVGAVDGAGCDVAFSCLPAGAATCVPQLMEMVEPAALAGGKVGP